MNNFPAWNSIMGDLMIKRPFQLLSFPPFFPLFPLLSISSALPVLPTPFLRANWPSILFSYFRICRQVDWMSVAKEDNLLFLFLFERKKKIVFNLSSHSFEEFQGNEVRVGKEWSTLGSRSDWLLKFGFFASEDCSWQWEISVSRIQGEYQ